MLRLPPLLLALTLLLSGAAAPMPPTAPPTDDPVELSFWHHADPSARPVLEVAIEQFEAEHPNVRVTLRDYGGRDRVLRKIMVHATLQGPPDLVWLPSTYASELVQTEYLLPVEELIARDPTFDADDIFAALWEASSVDSVRYSLPFAANDLAVFYNKRHFEEAGITRLPRTWREFVRAAGRLTRGHDGSDRLAFEVPYGRQEWAVRIWQTLLWQAGGDLLAQEDCSVAFEEPAGVQSLRFWKNLLRDGLAARSEPEGGSDPAAFLAGRISMQINGSWNVPAFEARGDLDFGTFPLPHYRRRATSVGSENLYLFRTSPEREAAAWELAKHLASTELQTQWALETAHLPVRRSTVESAAYQRHLAQQPALEPFVDQMDDGRARPPLTAYPSISTALGHALEQSLGPQQADPRAALRAAATEANRTLLQDGCEAL